MKIYAMDYAVFCLTATAHWRKTSVDVQATGKSLHGAALTSFAKKCCRGSRRLLGAETARRRTTASPEVPLGRGTG